MRFPPFRRPWLGSYKRGLACQREFAATTAPRVSPADPTLAPDTTIAQFADNFFQYDNQRHVTTEMVEGGTRAYGYQYFVSTFAADYNARMYKTIQTLPGGTQIVTYANVAGQVMLTVRIAGAGQPGNGPGTTALFTTARA
jgi:hypothetical protein